MWITYCKKNKSSLNIFEYRQTELNYEGENMKKWLFTSKLYKVTVLTIPTDSWRTSVVQCSLSNRTWRPGNRNLRQNFPRFSRQLFSEQLQPVASEHYLQYKITLLHNTFWWAVPLWLKSIPQNWKMTPKWSYFKKFSSTREIFLF